jgi:hypothetical protein
VVLVTSDMDYVLRMECVSRLSGPPFLVWLALRQRPCLCGRGCAATRTFCGGEFRSARAFGEVVPGERSKSVVGHASAPRRLGCG